MPSGKFYWEVAIDRENGGVIGIGAGSAMDGTALTDLSKIYGYSPNGQKYENGTGSSYGATYTTGDVIGVKFDAGTRQLEFLKNNSSQGVAFTVDSGFLYFPQLHLNNTDVTVNFGQRPFAYTPPTGYLSLCTQNLPDPTIADGSTAMDAVLYTGNGTSQTISGLGFSPDWVWTKLRSAGFGHRVWDTVRGATKRLEPHATTAEATESTALTAFTSDGFSVGSEANVNTTYLGGAFVAWCWDGGTSTATNTDGSITSSVRANASAGFSIISHVGTGTAGTFGHGLNAAPEFLIFKNRDAVDNWFVWFKAADGTATTGGVLNNANAFFTGSANELNSTLPTSSVISVGSNLATNGNTQDIITYAFAPVAGYSAFGSYTGNGSSDGPMVYTGFRPRWIMTKGVDNASKWVIYDTARETYNLVDTALYANEAYADQTNIYNNIDILSNGFKIRSNWSDHNTSGNDFIWACFAEHPFKTARAR